MVKEKWEVRRKKSLERELEILNDFDEVRKPFIQGKKILNFFGGMAIYFMYVASLFVLTLEFIRPEHLTYEESYTLLAWLGGMGVSSFFIFAGVHWYFEKKWRLSEGKKEDN